MALQDKEMGSDILDMLKHQCVGLTRALTECSNPELRQTLGQMRQFCEGAQWDMYRMAEQKGWYLPSAPADDEQVRRVRQFFQGVPAAAGVYSRDGGELRS